MLKNRLSLLKGYLFKNTEPGLWPSVIGIEITNRCNLDCLMCPRQNMTRSIGDMDMTLFKKIIDEISDKVEYVWLQAYGEPLLHKEVFGMIRYAKGRDLNVGLSTNATVIGSDMSDKLLESGLDYIILAFDGACKATYEKVRKGADYDSVIKNIDLFLRKKNERRSKMFAVVQCIYMRETEKEIKRFLNMWRKKGVNGIRIRQVTYSGEGKYKNLSKRACYWLWHDPYITWDGTLIPCCQDVNAVYPLGNVSAAPIIKLWNSRKMQELRQIHIEGGGYKTGLCKGCNMYQPGKLLVIGSSFFSASAVNKLVPVVESFISRLRY